MTNQLPTLHESKMQLIHERLVMFDGNLSRTARSLGVDQTSVYKWINRFDELAQWRMVRPRGNPKARKP